MGFILKRSKARFGRAVLISLVALVMSLLFSGVNFNLMSSPQVSAQYETINDQVVTITRSVIDQDANIVVTGQTQLGNSLVSKFDSTDGKILWADNFGGNLSEIMEGVEIDSKNNVIVVGRTYSADFPTKNGIQSTFGGSSDIFIRKWSSTGLLLWSTFLGIDRKQFKI